MIANRPNPRFSPAIPTGAAPVAGATRPVPRSGPPSLGLSPCPRDGLSPYIAHTYTYLSPCPPVNPACSRIGSRDAMNLDDHLDNVNIGTPIEGFHPFTGGHLGTASQPVAPSFFMTAPVLGTTGGHLGTHRDRRCPFWPKNGNGAFINVLSRAPRHEVNVEPNARARHLYCIARAHVCSEFGAQRARAGCSPHRACTRTMSGRFRRPQRARNIGRALVRQLWRAPVSQRDSRRPGVGVFPGGDGFWPVDGVARGARCRRGRFVVSELFSWQRFLEKGRDV